MTTIDAEAQGEQQQQKAGQQVAVIDNVRSLLEKMKGQFQLVLPKHLSVDRLLRVAITSCQNTPALLKCERRSLLSAVMTAATLGLEPDGVLGQAYLVPFKGRVTFVPGYKGLIKLARQTGEVIAISAHEVCEKDEFRWSYGLDEELHHKPASGERGEITHFYAYAKFKDGGHHFEVMTRADVEKIRNKSEAFQAFQAGKIKSTPWADHFIQMGRKTAIRRIANYLPMEVQKAALLDAAYEEGKHARVADDGNVVIEGGLLKDDEDGGGEPETETKALESFEARHGAATTSETTQVSSGKPSTSTETVDPETGEITEVAELDLVTITKLKADGAAAAKKGTAELTKWRNALPELIRDNELIDDHFRNELVPAAKRADDDNIFPGDRPPAARAKPLNGTPAPMRASKPTKSAADF